MPFSDVTNQEFLRFAQDFGGGLTPSTPLRVTPAKRIKLSRSSENGFGAGSKVGLWRRGHFFPGQSGFYFHAWRVGCL